MTPLISIRRFTLCAMGFIVAVSGPMAASGQATNSYTLNNTPLPDVGASLVRVFVALAFVLAIFLGGVWLFRNWQRLTVQRGRAPKLNVVEVRSLGGRHALYVVAYEQERFLLAASPTGVNLLSHLQPAEEGATPPPTTPTPASFAQTLGQMLKGK
jgi:flagellar biogenesis protein FliO